MGCGLWAVGCGDAESGTSSLLEGVSTHWGGLIIFLVITIITITNIY